MCLCSWQNGNDFPNSQSTRRELLCHPERMCNSSTPSQSVTCNPTASGTIAFQLQFIYKTTQVILCMLPLSMTAFYVFVAYLDFVQRFLIIHCDRTAGCGTMKAYFCVFMSCDCLMFWSRLIRFHEIAKIQMSLVGYKSDCTVYFIICPSVDFLFCRNIHNFYHVFPSKHLQVKVFMNWSLNN